MLGNATILRNAYNAGLTVPAFNVPYLPMVEPVVRAVADAGSFAFIASARLEWYKFEAKSAQAVKEEFDKWFRPECIRLHLDHVPVIDEDNVRIDFLDVIQGAVDLGFNSVMVDGSRLSLEENIAATRDAVAIAEEAGVPCEAELGAVLGHEEGPLPPYEELFESGKGFTDLDEARRFVEETGCSWLSVAIGNIHGAISAAERDKKKVEARLNLDHLAKLRDATGIPLVLHGGSGIRREFILEAIQNGVAKINIGTEIRQAYVGSMQEKNDVAAAQQAVYERTLWVLTDYLELGDSRERIAPPDDIAS